MKLINANKLAESFEKHQVHLTTIGDTLSSKVWQDAKFAVWDAPTVDAVPVVRCKDCKHWIPGWITDRDDFVPPSCKRNAGVWSFNSFCCDGERKDGERNDRAETV